MSELSNVISRMVEDSNQLRLKIKKLNDDATIPTRGTADSAGLDLYSCEDTFIEAGLNQAVHTGIAMEIPKGYVGLIFARSGLATKKHLRPANCVGVIDSDYRGEIIVNLMNDTRYVTQSQGRIVQVNPEIVETDMHAICEFIAADIKKGDRIAQIVIMPYVAPEIVEVSDLSDTDRGTGGFGSTGK